MTEASRPSISMENVPVQGPNAIKRILYLDAHGAFSRNIINFLETTLPVVVDLISIDEEIPRFTDMAKRYDAIIVGSGPGTLDDKKSLGLIPDVWRLDVPTLGIGLGFQSLCKQFGATIERLPELEYGARATVYHGKQDIFSEIGESEGEDDYQGDVDNHQDGDGQDFDSQSDEADVYAPHFTATIYQSHRVVLGHPVEQPEADGEQEIMYVPGSCKQLQPLAWRIEQGPGFGAIVMAVRHIFKPFWGLQFHPESHGSSVDCKGLISCWWSQVQRFNLDRTPIDRPNLNPLANMDINNLSADFKVASRVKVVSDRLIEWSSSAGSKVYYREIPPRTLTVERVSEKVGVPYSRCVVLKIDCDCSVISVPSPGSWVLNYSLSKDMLHAEHLETKQTFDERPGDIHEVIRQFLNAKGASGGNNKSFFWGGLLGYFSYDAGVRKFGVRPAPVVDDAVDVSLLWTERSIVIDRKKGVWIQSLRQDDDKEGGWLDCIVKQLSPGRPTNAESEAALPEAIPSEAIDTFFYHQMQPENDLMKSFLQGRTIILPEEQEFRDQIERAREFIQSGDVYQLFLATHAKVELPKCEDPNMKALRSWLLSKKLAEIDTSYPCHAYMQLGPKIITLGSEVLMVWRREGWFTNGPSSSTWRPTMSPEEALEHAKRPEKTMAVDLASNDLHDVSGSGDFHIDQMIQPFHPTMPSVATINWGFSAQIPPVLKKYNVRIKTPGPRSGNDDHPLTKCLPPFQTTGAPKKNAAKIIADVQGARGRGIQGGIVGFFDVGGCGEWHIVDRAAFSFSGDQAEQELWHVGAGAQVMADTSPDLAWKIASRKMDRMLHSFRIAKEKGNANVQQEDER